MNRETQDHVTTDSGPIRIRVLESLEIFPASLGSCKDSGTKNGLFRVGPTRTVHVFSETRTEQMPMETMCLNIDCLPFFPLVSIAESSAVLYPAVKVVGDC